MGVLRNLTTKDVKKGDVLESAVYGYSSYKQDTYMAPGDIGVITNVMRYSTYDRIELECLEDSGRIRKRFFLVSPNGATGYRKPSETLGKKLGSLKAKTFIEKLESMRDKQIYLNCPKWSGYYVGTDPECFVLSKDGEVIPAFTFLKSSEEWNKKPDPHGIKHFWDGFQAEWNPQPNSCLQSLSGGIRVGMKAIYDSARVKHEGAKIATISVVEVPKAILDTASDEHVALGCAPSLNAYPDVTPIDILDPRKLPLRFAGCHVHLGTGIKKPENAAEYVKILDKIAGVAMVSLFQGLEDPRRRQFYGRAGEFRLPKHGLEYRVPPAEVMSHPVVYHLCFDLVRQAYGFQKNYPKLASKEWDATEEETREAINNCDVKLARKILDRNEKLLCALYGGAFGQSQYVIANFKRLVFDGANNWLEMKNPVFAWNLQGTHHPTTNYEMLHASLTEKKKAVKGAA